MKLPFFSRAPFISLGRTSDNASFGPVLRTPPHPWFLFMSTSICQPKASPRLFQSRYETSWTLFQRVWFYGEGRRYSWRILSWIVAKLTRGINPMQVRVCVEVSVGGLWFWLSILWTPGDYCFIISEASMLAILLALERPKVFTELNPNSTNAD